MGNKISYNYSDLLKFFSCILIYTGHFLFRDYNNWVSDFGYIGSILFFFFSAYGISVSQRKKKLNLVDFTFRRIIKIWLPLVCVNIIFVCYESILYEKLIVLKFHLIEPYIENISQIDFLALFLYIVDYYQMDPVTWFLHELLIAYFVIWGLMKIKNKRNRIVLALGCYVFCEAIAYVFLFSSMVKIDTIGLLLGFLYANSGGQYLKNIERKNIQIVFCLLCFSIIGKILNEFLLVNKLIRYFIIFDGLEIFYNSCIVLILILLQKYIKIGDNRTFCFKFIGGVSFYVYLVHIKVIDLMDWYSYWGCLLVTLSVSLAFYLLVDKCILTKLLKRL